MKLVLVRHGIAIDREEAIFKGMEDSLRPLTEKGIERTKKVFQGLSEIEEGFDLIVTSPFVRAQQTAELLLRYYPKTEIKESLELIPSAAPQSFANWLGQYAKIARQVAVVGHEPQLSTFASWLLGGSMRSFISLKKAGILALEVESLESLSPKNAELVYLLQPKVLAK